MSSEDRSDRPGEKHKPRVVHCRREPYDVYIGRAMPRFGLPGSKWGNPFRVGRDGDRAVVIAKYEQHLREDPELIAALPELRGKDLGCWCAPDPCHGDVLLQMANGGDLYFKRSELDAWRESGGARNAA